VLTGRVISRHGHVRPTLVVGALVLLAGLVLLSTLGQETPFVLVGCYIALAGAGLGVIGETLTIVVQNAVPRGQIGAAGALVAFGRMAGGIGGVTVLGAALAASVGHRLAGVHMAGFDAHALPALARLAPPLRALVQAAYAQGVAHVYLLTVPVGLVVLGAMLALPAHRLSDEHPQG
ncbi:MAG TPA: hypothetical protein VN222_07180, partial [Novosphingobium sp.]|nr:hypothetical protein [Novosphingobium sp.]